VVRVGGLAPVAGLVEFFFVSGFLARKIPTPVSTPTSWAATFTTAHKLKQSAAKLKTAARSIASVLIITLLVLFGNVMGKKNLWITEELLYWIVDQLRRMI
jgi:hypothetical protein